MSTGNSPAHDPWDLMRRTTQARIGLRRSGYTLSTRDVLTFQADHAAARDAVHTPMDIDTVGKGLRELGFGEPIAVTSRASSRAEYLRRPDLGRMPADLSSIESSGADIGIVIADGLSATAVDTHAVALVDAVTSALTPQFTVAPPVLASQARVALGDHIGEALGVEMLIVIIGERPGLSVADSLGIYLTYAPEPGRRDSERNCISNIHPPDGLGYADAARIVAALVAGARQLGASGVALKDTSAGEAAVAAAEQSGLT
ncbi:MAG: ethanolamine ammonia-lyase subunit EutC [Gordonia polyisoprenivorans]|nr:ethanolamine ammonia-lyase subunit EutC [Gordonia polyisoprenivorans]